ncbi:hypothetical protein EM595_0103 [Duffyella gerundensis]|uniref:Uncharacterized protein n=1 Tax=Duffyella gerundensis TaxID=1619313 RepID=A0A0U5GGD5_9GAMM|nr:hypothetical protein EM595_0103 [Duffyella gerundensis]
MLAVSLWRRKYQVLSSIRQNQRKEMAMQRKQFGAVP